MIKRLLLFGFLLLALYSCSPQPDCSHLQGTQTCTRILFIGNSYTYVNDLPGMFAKLARAGGYPVETGMAAEGGFTLADHLNSPHTLDELAASKWNFVVLQEQSEVPAIEQSRVASMYPAARSLVQKIELLGARPIFFMTWGHLNGAPEFGIQSYADMQILLDQGYLRIADELNAPLAPVGFAWSQAESQNSQLALWQADGSHPSELGTYLAACVFYAVIFRQSPEGLTYHAGLPKDMTQSLQTIAATVVLGNPSQWNLP
jgi:hypothetical protein